ncbi:MAG: SUMF1/EgtB/PvdO family nonheme iron enzyme [Bacteroidales bacterium]|nr:SUMF1/EgtB/PvdO family nonheme iron enzyme [Bacteroidales bacterium]
MKIKLFILFSLLGVFPVLKAQQANPSFSDKKGLFIDGLELSYRKVKFKNPTPFFSLDVNDQPWTFNKKRIIHGDTIIIKDEILNIKIWPFYTQNGSSWIIECSNQKKEIIKISNFVPFGESSDKAFITGKGSYEWPGYLCRSQLFRPGYAPLGVVLPDNAWHLGFSSLETRENQWVTSIIRRKNIFNIKCSRWHAELKAGEKIRYQMWSEIHHGGWIRGMEIMFRERWLHDLETFDQSLYQRPDLAWIRNSWIMLLQFAWDSQYYDSEQQESQLFQTLNDYIKPLGGIDIYTLWPTWPRLGLDERNQFDLYADLPGGLAAIKLQTESMHTLGKKFFISYNPWDESTRTEDHLQGMARLLKDTDADGVVLDTRGKSSAELQAAADNVKPGIIMYSEGMAVPADMPGIVSGRVHDALFMPPLLNLNKYIKPDFAIFRVIQMADEYIHREASVAFFNGYGMEINTMKPGRPISMRTELEFLGLTTKILRENASVFFKQNYQILIPTLKDSIWVNKWPSEEKIIYTIYSLQTDGFDGPLFLFDNSQLPNPSLADKPYHIVSLWNHEEVKSSLFNGKHYIHVRTSPFDKSFLHSRREGSVECIAILPNMLEVEQKGDSLRFGSYNGDRIRLNAGNPSYNGKYIDFESGHHRISLFKHFGNYEGKVVIQLFAGNELLDERYGFIPKGLPRLISENRKSTSGAMDTTAMSFIYGGPFSWFSGRSSELPESFIPYPAMNDSIRLEINDLWVDTHPVSNAQFYHFLKHSGYNPSDTTNFLKHWTHKRPQPHQMDKAVVFISLEDALAYCEWAGKRLPSEAEWQYIAGNGKVIKYPWGNEPDTIPCTSQHPNHTNTSCSKANNTAGLSGLCGNVWQLTNDIYNNGSYTFVIMKGGTSFKPDSSIWYLEGGPRPISHPQMLLMVSPSFDRSAFVGFRCIKDVNSK